MLLGKILKHIRVFGDYTQSELAEKIDISSSYISEIETDKKTIQELSEIAEKMEKKLGYNRKNNIAVPKDMYILFNGKIVAIQTVKTIN
jgi:transcriptional regulator with XRE-family HTH domain